jgi:hypothetical protein
MKTQFAPEEITLELKALGFDETCFGYYDGTGYVMIKEIKHCVISAPTFAQAFRFFRDKYELYYTIEGSKKYGFAFFIYYENDDKGELKSKEYSTYEEAEQECLIKLIEITKEKK